MNAVSLAKISVQTKICTTLFREIIISPVEMSVMLRSALGSRLDDDGQEKLREAAILSLLKPSTNVPNKLCAVFA